MKVIDWWFNLLKSPEEKRIDNLQKSLYKKGYKKYNKKEPAKWVLKKWSKIHSNNHPLDLEGKIFYFKGKRFRYAVHLTYIMVPAQGHYDYDVIFYWKKRKKSK